MFVSSGSALTWADMGLRGSAVNLGRHQRGPSLDTLGHSMQRSLDNPFMSGFVPVIGRPFTFCHNFVET